MPPAQHVCPHCCMPFCLKASPHRPLAVVHNGFSRIRFGCAERLRRELYDSQQDNASLESSLRCKVSVLASHTSACSEA